MARITGPSPVPPDGAHQGTTAVGIITAGTILVSAVIAGYVAVAVTEPATAQAHVVLVGLSAFSVIVSVVSYVSGVMFGLTTLNLPAGPQRARELRRTAIAFYLEAFSAALFALVVIVGSLLAGNGLSNPRSREPSTEVPTYYKLMDEARYAHAHALLLLEDEQTRVAAITAWAAVGKATDALLAARVGIVPTTTAMTSQWLDHMVGQDPAMENLALRYRYNVDQLHDVCFYKGNCDSETPTRIRDVAHYISEVQRLVEGDRAEKGR